MYAIIQLLVAFPKLFELFKKLNDELLLEMDRRQFNRNSELINDWVRNGKKKQDS